MEGTAILDRDTEEVLWMSLDTDPVNALAMLRGSNLKPGHKIVTFKGHSWEEGETTLTFLSLMSQSIVKQIVRHTPEKGFFATRATPKAIQLVYNKPWHSEIAPSIPTSKLDYKIRTNHLFTWISKAYYYKGVIIAVWEGI